MRMLNRIFGIIVLLLICLPQVAYGQTATFIEPGSDATQDVTTFYNTILGAVTSATDQAHTGPRSIKLDVTGTPANASFSTPAGVLADAGRRIDVWRRFDTATTGDDTIINILTSAPLGIFNIRQTSGGLLKIVLNSGGTLVTGTHTISANTFHRLTVTYTIASTSVYSIQLYIDGVADASVVNGTALPRVGSDHVLFLISSGANSANAHAWVDDIYIDTGSGLSDPGNIIVTAKRPLSNGSANGMTGSGTPSGYGTGNARYVNEQPLSQSNFVSVVAVGVTTEEYNIENAAVGDRSIPLPGIVATEGWIVASVLAGTENASLVLNNVTSTAALTTTPTTFFAIGAAYPANAGTDIGIITTNLATTVSLYECGVIVAYKLIGTGFFGF